MTRNRVIYLWISHLAKAPSAGKIMSIPPRWLNCPRKGKIIAGKFIPFKTPLSSRYDPQIPDGSQFNMPMLVGYVQSLGMKLGMVVDLTKTDRFYDKRDLQQMNIGHYKLKCEGFEEAPTMHQVNTFNQFCAAFFNEHPGEVIGVHCTHGYNRTGFLIIAYLVEIEDWGVEAAVAAFAQARPPGIYKHHYLEDLANRYNDGSMDGIVIPTRPEWCFEGDDPGGREDNEGGEASKGKEPMGRKKAGKKGIQNENAKFMEGVSGVSVVRSPKREEIQQQCQYILKWDRSGFPGSQPVSMDVQNIRLLHEKPYRVSWKADGTRYMMYINGPREVYLIDRDNSVFVAPQIVFPARKRPGDYVKDTLVDGEMVLDKTKEGIRPRYLMYDIVQFEGSAEVAQCDHKRRQLCVQKELIEPRDAAAQQGMLDKQSEPFGIRAKIFWDVSETQMVLEKFIPQITHENDGLVFSPTADPYVPGQCNELLKWKPADLNTVDFRLSIVEMNKPGKLPERVGQLFVGGCRDPFSTLDLQRNKEARQHNGRIVECYWDINSGGWNFMRVREDKSFPNSYTTAISVCKSIRQPVTKDWLLEVVNKHRWRPPLLTDSSHGTKRQLEGSSNSELMPPPKMNPRIART